MGFKKERTICNKITYGYTVLFILILLIVYFIIHIGLAFTIYSINRNELLHKKGVFIEEIKKHIENEKVIIEEELGKGKMDWKKQEKLMIEFLLDHEYNSYLKLKIDDEVKFQSTQKINIEIPMDEKANEVWLKIINGELYMVLNVVEEFTMKYGEEAGKKFKAYYQIIKDVDEEKNYFRVIFILVGIADLLGIILVILSGKILSKRLLTPINNIIDTAEKISIHDLNKRVQVSSAGDELTKMGNVINDMISRLEDSFKKQNKFVSDASHELRTPLSILQGYVEIIDGWGKKDPKILDESIQSIKEEVFNMKNLIEKLLFLARGESGTIKLNKNIINGKELIEKVIRDAKIIAENHEIINSKLSDIEFFGDEDLIIQCIRALVDNSIKYTREKGKIEINSSGNKDYIVLEIIDSGIGIKTEEKEKIFDRFYRVDESRTKDTGGNGLGLAIVKSIIELHKGKIEIESELNKGTRVSLIFPLK